MSGRRGEPATTRHTIVKRLLGATVLAMALLVVAAPAASAAVYWGYVNSNRAGVASGVKADTNAVARHQNAENYTVRLTTGAGDAYLYTALSKDAGFSTFQLRVYLKYKVASDNPYNPASRYQTLTYSPGGLTGWHELKLAKSTGTYWKLYLDGTVKDWYVDWPYTDCYASTYAEGAYSTGAPAATLNHTNDFWTLQSGTWYVNGAASEPGSNATSPYYINYVYNYYDWMGSQ